MIELYAIARHPGPPLPTIAPLRELPCEGLAAVCAPVTADEEEPTEAALWRHEGIVEALMEGRDLLPVRYGTRVAGEREAMLAVAARADELRAALDRVQGAVELSLRIRAHEPAPAAELHVALEPLAREALTRPGRDEHELLRAAYLVSRDGVDRFRDEVTRLQRAHPELALLLTGPWPPYSFVEP